MVYDGILIGLVVGFIRGGILQGLRGLSAIRLKAGWIFPLLLLMQFLIFFLQVRYDFLLQYSGYLFMAIYLAGLIFLFLNANHTGFKLIFTGVLLNFIVMALNGGVMPVSGEAAALLGGSFLSDLQSNEIVYKHAILEESTRLPFLGDIIPLTAPYPREQVISIGDIVMNMGIFFFLQSIMVPSKRSAEVTSANRAEAS